MSTISFNAFFCESGIVVSPHEAVRSPEGPLQYLKFLSREGPEVVGANDRMKDKRGGHSSFNKSPGNTRKINTYFKHMMILG